MHDIKIMCPAVAPQRSILWFRKGLRLHDNPSLLAAIKGATHLYPVFVLDPWFLKPDVVGVNRLNFLLESLTGSDLPHAFYQTSRCIPLTLLVCLCEVHFSSKLLRIPCRSSQQSPGEGVQPLGIERQSTGCLAKGMEGLEHHSVVL